MLDLPKWNQLTDQQKLVATLPFDESHIVVGPPGSGKTVLAIRRARTLCRKFDVPFHLLMFGRPLMQFTDVAISQSFTETEAGETDSKKCRSLLGQSRAWKRPVTTFHSWFYNWYEDQYGEYPPELKKFEYDWAMIEAEMQQNPIPELEREHLIIDEGQDLPMGFYRVLPNIAQTYTVFADENQGLSESSRTHAEIQDALGIDSVVRLTENHRNPPQVAGVASHFFDGSVAELPTVMQLESGRKPMLIEVDRAGGLADMLVNLEASLGPVEIGVFLPENWHQEALVAQLQARKTKSPVGCYVYTRNPKCPPLRLGQPGIKVLNYESAKGLQFDTVVIPALELLDSDLSSARDRTRFYVLASRARKDLRFSYGSGTSPRAKEGLPLGLLEEKSLVGTAA